MKYLLDTHTAIWALEDKSKLSDAAKAVIDNVSFPLCVSIASAWEIAIKVSIGKLTFNGGSPSFLEKMQHNGVELLSIESSHLEHLEHLPFIHRDPFDRLIVATAKTHSLVIVTSDDNIQKYDVQCVW